MEKQKLKVLIAGLGSIGQRHARNLRELFGDELDLSAYRVRGLEHVITRDLTIKPNSKISSEYGITEYFNLAQALEDKPDAVFVTNPSSMHVDVALAAASAGSHLFIEKPLSHSMKGIEELKSIVHAKSLVAFVGYPLRFHPCHKKVKELLLEKVLGRVTHVQYSFGEYLPDWHKYEDYRISYAARSDQGGGVILTQIHDLDLLYDLFGFPSKIAAFGGKLGELDIDVEDSVDMLMEMKSPLGAVTVHLHQDFLQQTPTRKSEIHGTEGKIVCDFVSQKIEWFKRAHGNPTVFDFGGFDRNRLFLLELRHFLECIKSGSKTIVSLEDAEASLRIALAAKKSLESSSVVSI